MLILLVVPHLNMVQPDCNLLIFAIGIVLNIGLFAQIHGPVESGQELH
jgi:hypothetical protein